jgi:hypothetical protein
MNEAESKIDTDRSDEARMLATLCARANATRRASVTVRMGESSGDSVRMPHRLMAAN